MTRSYVIPLTYSLLIYSRDVLSKEYKFQKYIPFTLKFYQVIHQIKTYILFKNFIHGALWEAQCQYSTRFFLFLCCQALHTTSSKFKKYCHNDSFIPITCRLQMCNRITLPKRLKPGIDCLLADTLRTLLETCILFEKNLYSSNLHI